MDYPAAAGPARARPVESFACRPPCWRANTGRAISRRWWGRRTSSRRSPTRYPAASPSRLPVHRHARRRQDDDRANPRQVAQLHRPRRQRRHHGAAVRRVRCLSRHRRRPLHRLRRARRRLEPRRRRDHEAARPGGLQACCRSLQGLPDRRSAHALDDGVQRDAEDARGAARLPQVHPGDHRSAEGAGDGAVALPPVQPATDGAGDDRAPSRRRTSRPKTSPPSRAR